MDTKADSKFAELMHTIYSAKQCKTRLSLRKMMLDVFSLHILTFTYKQIYISPVNYKYLTQLVVTVFN